MREFGLTVNYILQYSNQARDIICCGVGGGRELAEVFNRSVFVSGHGNNRFQILFDLFIGSLENQDTNSRLKAFL